MADQQSSAVNDLSTATRTAASVAKETVDVAKSAASAAGKAATGNLVGAAADLLKNKTFRAIILGTIATLVLIVVGAFYAVPSMLFSAAEEVANNMTEEIVAEIVTSEQGTISYYVEIAAASEIIGGATQQLALKTMVNFIISLFTKKTSEDLIEYGDNVFDTAFDESAAKEILNKQIEEVLKLFSNEKNKFGNPIGREGQYQKLLDEIATSFTNRWPDYAINIGADKLEITTTLDAPVMTEYDALQYISAYSVQRGNGLQDVELRSLLSWMGNFNGSGANKDVFVVEDREFKTYDWFGDWLPQYQYEQWVQEYNQWVQENEDETYQFDQWIQEDISKTGRTAFETDDFLSQVYYVDKDTGISIEYGTYTYYVQVAVVKTPEAEDTEGSNAEGNDESPSESPAPSEAPSDDSQAGDSASGESGGEASPSPVIEYVTVPVVVATMDITMTITKEPAYVIEDDIMGFWEGELLPGVNRETSDDTLLSFSWNSGDKTYYRQAGYQTTYFEELQDTSAAYMDIDAVDTSDIDFTFVGAQQSSSTASENLVQMAETQLGTIGGSKYWRDYGNNEWCALFVNWCAEESGAPAALVSAISASCTTTWRNFGGTAIGTTYQSGSSHKGYTVMAENTAILGGSWVPQRGDFVIYVDENNAISHIGIVEYYDAATNDLVTVEGNVGARNNSSSMVVNLHRTTTQKYGTNYKSYNILGFIRHYY